MGSGDEGAIPAGTGKNDIARLIPNLECPFHMRRLVAQRDDADAVRHVIDYPGFVVVANGHGDRLQANRNGGAKIKTGTVDLEDFEFGVRRVYGQQEFPVRSNGQRPDLTALERRKVLAIRVTIRKYTTCVTQRQARDDGPKYQIPGAACGALLLHSSLLSPLRGLFPVLRPKLTGTVRLYYFVEKVNEAGISRLTK